MNIVFMMLSFVSLAGFKYSYANPKRRALLIVLIHYLNVRYLFMLVDLDNQKHYLSANDWTWVRFCNAFAIYGNIRQIIGISDETRKT